MKQVRRAFLLIALLSLCVLTACGGDGDPSPTPTSEQPSPTAPSPTPTAEPTPGPGSPPRVTLHMSDGNEIVLELYPDKAPNTVGNFLFRAEEGFYVNSEFEKLTPGQRVQGGNPVGSILLEYTIKGEMSKNGFAQNDLTNVRGVVGMMREDSYDSAFAEFYILTADYPAMDGEYCVFGKVIKGLEHVDAYTNGTGGAYMEKLTTETYGVNYKENLEFQISNLEGLGGNVQVEVD